MYEFSATIGIKPGEWFGKWVKLQWSKFTGHHPRILKQCWICSYYHFNWLNSQNYADQSIPTHLTNAANISIHQIGKMAPYWVPDNMTVFCMQCNQKFSFIKRRHHCRACGLVLCSTCCSSKAKLEYLGDVEARVCTQCDILLNRNKDPSRENDTSGRTDPAINSPYGEMHSPMTRSPNPNNPMEYCSVIPPHQQVTSSTTAPISVMVTQFVLLNIIQMWNFIKIICCRFL